MKGFIEKIALLTRAKDWRLSFVPFVLACVYAWMFLLQLPFSWYHLFIFFLSLTTTIGFAAFGYFINEYFDQKEDALAGKINKLSFLKPSMKLLLFVAILLITFAPWLFLPKNNLSYWLVGFEVFSFLLYSLPFPRLKNKAFFAGILDASYAYFIPGILSFHTFSLLAPQIKAPHFIILFFATLFFVGYRNIFIHQIKDVLGDQKAGLRTLPMVLGPKKSNSFLLSLGFIELALMGSFLLSLCNIHPIFVVYFLSLIALLFFKKQDFMNLIGLDKDFSLLPARHLTDDFYQFIFPVLNVFFLLWVDWRWISIALIHLLLFVPKSFWFKLWSILWHQNIRPALSFILNQSIYVLFKILGVDLIKEQSSASNFLRKKMKL
jgi:4-hydroxybenzoate polyprenyltransferase